jgi:hypothetical protein
MVARRLLPLCLAAVLFDAAAGQDEPDLALRIVAPSVELTTQSEFDAAALMDVSIAGVQGWSLGIGHDGAALELLEAAIGSAAATANMGGLPQFNVLNTAPAGGTGLTQAIVLNFTQPVTLPIAKDQELVSMRYRVLANPAEVDPCVPIEAAIAFTDTLGAPPVTTTITVQGESFVPALTNAPLTVRCPGSIEITRCEGDTENIYLEWTFGGPPDWDFLFLYRDGEFLSMLEIDALSYTDLGLEPGDYTYTLITFVVTDPTNPSLVFAYCTGTVIPVTVTAVAPGSGNWLGGDEITLTGLAFTSLEDTRVFFIADGEEPLPLTVLEVNGETEIKARTPRSTRLGLYGVRVENSRGAGELANAFDYGFIRGEMNSELGIDIADASYALSYLFLGTVKAPLCEDSVDVTDDGKIDISDPIILLTFLFLGGDPPRPPYPNAGKDPTTRDPLGCLP